MSAPVQHAVRWPLGVAAGLTFGAGAVDVLALTHLGGVFASVMTGNLALMGLGLARLDAVAIGHAVVAVVGYAAGVAVGARLIGARDPDGPVWPRSVTVTLAVELVATCVLVVGWLATRGDPAGVTQGVLLAAAAAAMGLQGAAMRGLGVTLATTYLTGTLTGLVTARAGTPRTRGDRSGAVALVGAVAGAACGGVTLMAVPLMAPLLCAVPVAVVLVIAELHRYRTRTTRIKATRIMAARIRTTRRTSR